MLELFVFEAPAFPFLFVALLQITHKTLCRFRAIYHCHPFRKKSFKKSLDVLQHFGFSEPIEAVSPFVFIKYRRVALISCRCHTCYNVETLTRQKHTYTQAKRLHTLPCGLHPVPGDTHEGELGAAGDSPVPMCSGLFASQAQIDTAYILHSHRPVAAGMIFQQDVLKLPKNTCCSVRLNVHR